MKAQIMKTAWTIAKEAAIKFGGSSKQYISAALKQAWSSKPQVKVLKKTEKAVMLHKDGVKFWVQNKWLRADMTLTAKGIESFNKAKASNGQVGREVKATIIRETEKAILISYSASYKKSGGSVEKWLPKTQVLATSKNLITVSTWAFRELQKHVASKIHGALSNRVEISGREIETAQQTILRFANS